MPIRLQRASLAMTKTTLCHPELVSGSLLYFNRSRNKFGMTGVFLPKSPLDCHATLGRTTLSLVFQQKLRPPTKITSYLTLTQIQK
jgi:hypothetical protein